MPLHVISLHLFDCIYNRLFHNHTTILSHAHAIEWIIDWGYYMIGLGLLIITFVSDIYAWFTIIIWTG